MRLSVLALRRAVFTLVAVVGFAHAGAAIASSNGLVISQAYGGGGNTGSTFRNDFIEIFNAGANPVSLNGYSVQYASSTGSSWAATPLTNVMLGAGQYYLVQQAAGTGGTTNLPAPDVTGAIAMSASAGKVALVSSTTALTGAQPTGSQIIDVVGYGTGTNFFEGTGPAPAPSASNAVIRSANGCTDTDNNAGDFTAQMASPRNTASTTNPCGAPAGTSLAINDVTMAEGNSGTTNFVFTVTKTGPDAASVAFATTDGSATQPGDYASNSGTLTFLAGDTTMTITVAVVGDTAVEGNETFTVTLSNATGATLSDASGTGTITNDDMAAGTACGDPATLISTVQGSGSVTTLTGTVQIEGIVTGDFQGSTGLKGFFMQAEDAQADGNAATSEGIFVFEDAATPANVSVGDRVRVTGMPAESFGQTVISGPTTTFCAGGQMLPALTDVSLPFAAAESAERFEGMRVRLPQNLYVTSNFELGRFGEVTLSSADRLINPTQNNAPGGAGSARATAQAANDLNKILIDDGNSVQNRDPIKYPNTGLTAENTLRGGDRVQNLEGIMSFGFSKYRIQPTTTPVFVAENQRQNAPELPGAAGSFRVASFNVLNYFNGDGAGGGFPTSRGADTQEEFTRQRDKIIAAMTAMRADVLGLIEIENDDFTSSSAIADLVSGLNTAAPSGTTYAYVTPAAGDLTNGKLGSDAIKVSFIYRTQTVTLVGPAKVLDDRFNTRFTTSCNRPALAQTFKQTSSSLKFTAVVNHFKSKGSACSALSDTDAGDGQGNGHEARRRAATVLRDWLATDPTASGDADFLILGDLNAYAKEDPVTILEAAGFVNVAQRDHGAAPLLSYPFNDQWGTLDYGLASASLASQVTKAVDWTINGAEPLALDYNIQLADGSVVKTPGQKDSLYNPDAFRSSDHDPVVMEMSAAACNAGTLGFSGAPYTVAEGAALTVTVTRTGGTCGTVGVSYATGDGTGAMGAVSPADYTGTSGTLSFADGEMSKTFTVSAQQDTLDEANEIFGLALSGATGGAALSATPSTTATITDDDASPTAQFAVASSSVAENVMMTTVTMTLSTASGRSVEVPFSVTGSAMAGMDYTQNTSSPVTFAAGETSKAITFTITDDSSEEPAETIVLDIGTPSHASVGTPATHTLTIEASDAPAQDATPDNFSFIERTNLQPGTATASELVTITGFTGTLAVTVSAGGQCSIIRQGESSGSPFANTCTIAPGDRLMVSHVTAAEQGTAKESTVTIGNTTAIFRTVTGTVDRVPNAFGWTTQNDIAPGTVVESNVITLAGYNAPAVIEAPQVGVQYRVNAGDWTNVRGSLPVGATLQIRHTTDAGSRAYTRSRLRVGGVDGVFTTRNRK